MQRSGILLWRNNIRPGNSRTEDRDTKNILHMNDNNREIECLTTPTRVGNFPLMDQPRRRSVCRQGWLWTLGRSPLLGHLQHTCSQSGPCPGAHGPHQGQSGVSDPACSLSWRIRECFCGHRCSCFNGKPVTVESACVSKEHLAPLLFCNAQSFASSRPLVLQRLNSVLRQASLTFRQTDYLLTSNNYPIR